MKFIPGGAAKDAKVKEVLGAYTETKRNHEKSQQSLQQLLFHAEDVMAPKILTELLSYANTLDQVGSYTLIFVKVF